MNCVGDFIAGRTWALGTKRDFEGTQNFRRISESRSKNFEKVIEWMDEQIEATGSVEFDVFKTKYTEINGYPSKSWMKVSKRVRDRLELTSS